MLEAFIFGVLLTVNVLGILLMRRLNKKIKAQNENATVSLKPFKPDCKLHRWTNITLESEGELLTIHACTNCGAISGKEVFFTENAMARAMKQDELNKSFKEMRFYAIRHFSESVAGKRIDEIESMTEDLIFKLRDLEKDLLSRKLALTRKDGRKET